MPPQRDARSIAGITGRGGDGDACEACECECDERLSQSQLTPQPSLAAAAVVVSSVKGVAEGHAQSYITTKQLDWRHEILRSLSDSSMTKRSPRDLPD